MNLGVARFAPHGVNWATPGFLENLVPHGAHFIQLYICLKAIGKCCLYMERIYFCDFFLENPQTKTVKMARFAPTPPK